MLVAQRHEVIYFGCEETNGQNIFKFGCFQGEKQSCLKINSVDYVCEADQGIAVRNTGSIEVLIQSSTIIFLI